jgi:uncharacterized protein YbjT (DUF2867 family)
MSGALKNVIVVGGSGNVGREIVATLLASNDDFGTIATLKRKEAPTSDVVKRFQAQGVKVLEADYKDKASLVEAFKGTTSCEMRVDGIFRGGCDYFDR